MQATPLVLWPAAVREAQEVGRREPRGHNSTDQAGLKDA